MSAITKERLTALSRSENVGAILGEEIAELARIALASLEADPIGFAFADDVDLMRKKNKIGGMLTVRHHGEVALFTAPPPPGFWPHGLLDAFDKYARQFTYNNHPAKPEMFPERYPFFEAGYRAAMLQSFGNSEQLNSPVIPDGWVACSERMPEVGGLYLCYVQDEYEFDISHFCFEYLAAHKKFDSAGINITHWMPLPAAPQQEY